MTPPSSEWLFFFHVSPPNPYMRRSSPTRATCPAHIIHLYLITWIIPGEEYKSWNSPQPHFLHSTITYSIFDTQIFLLSDTLCSCWKVHLRDQISHPCKKTGKIIVLYILIFLFLGSKPEPIHDISLIFTESEVSKPSSKITFVSFHIL